MSRSLRVEQARHGRWRVSCQLHYGDIDGRQSYAVKMAISHRGGVTAPAGGTVGPKAARIEMDDGSNRLVARLKGSTLDVERTL